MIGSGLIESTASAEEGDPPSDGDAGNITLNSDVLALDGAFVQANADSGQGGEVNVNTRVTTSRFGVNLGGDRADRPDFNDSVELRGNVIQAASASGINGAVTVTSPVFDVNAVVNDLDSDFIDVTDLARDPCAAFVKGAPSSCLLYTSPSPRDRG